MFEASALDSPLPKAGENENYNELANQAAPAFGLLPPDSTVHGNPDSIAYGKERPSRFWQSVNLAILITCLVLITLAADYHVITSAVG